MALWGTISSATAEISCSQAHVRTLISELSLTRNIKKRLKGTLQKIATIRDDTSRGRLHYEICRMLTYVRDIPFFSGSTFLEKQSHVIDLAATAVKQSEYLTLADYPHSPSRPCIRFIFHANQVKPPFPSTFKKQKPIAVFKAQKRMYEIFTWEIACLFGIEDAFTPGISLMLDEMEGELQLFQLNDLTKQQSYDENLYELVTFHSYMQCALGVLLFALEDIHNENCYFQFHKEGYLQMGMYDTTAAFCRTSFLPYHKYPDYPSLLTPYCWIGWDFPQYHRKISKTLARQLVHLIESWPERAAAFRDYLAHPMTPHTLSKSQGDGIVERSQRLVETVRRHPKKPVRTWHETLVPRFPIVKKKLKEFFPKRKATWLLFRLQWFPASVYPSHRRQEFETWLHQFLAEESQSH